MSKLSSGLAIGIAAFVAIGAVPRAVVAEGHGLPTVVLTLHDRADVFPDVLDQATKETSRIYRQAGVQVRWVSPAIRASVVAADEEQSSAEAFTVQVIVLPRNRAAVPASAGGSFLMGAAERTSRACGGAAYVFYDHVQGLANVQQVAVARVLGSVIAHEIGHLVRQRHGHSPEGLMRALWNVSDWELVSQGRLLFSSTDSWRMRSTLLTCRE